MNPSNPATKSDVLSADSAVKQSNFADHTDSDANELTAATVGTPDENDVIGKESEAEIAEMEASKGDWQLWPPSPKMQIVLIAIAFGLFNLILIGIWAAVMVYRF